MADPNEKVPTHDLSFEPAKTAFNAEGWTDVVNGQGTGAARLVEAKDSTSARVRALMETKGLSEKDASEQAINELDQRIEGKTADVATYIERFSEVALTTEEVTNLDLNDPRKQRSGSPLPFTARAILYPDRGDGEFLLRYGARDGSIKEVRIQATAIASVREAINGREPGEAGWNDGYARQAYAQIKGALKTLEFRFDQPTAKIEDIPTGYDQDVNNAINRKRHAARKQEAEDKLNGFKF